MKIIITTIIVKVILMIPITSTKKLKIIRTTTKKTNTTRTTDNGTRDEDKGQGRRQE
jgi:hypothetical protein